MKLKKIKVYGRLRKFLGSSYFEAAVSSPAEAIRFLMCNFPEVEAHMSQQYYKIKMNNLDINLDFLQMKGQGDIQIIPIATGSGFFAPFIGAIFSTGAAVASAAVGAVSAVAGTALAVANTVAGAVVAGAGALAAEIGTTGILGTITTAVATDLAIGGVTSLLAPTPAPFESPIGGSGGSGGFGASEPDGALDPQMANSYSFSGIQNVSVSGVSVPIIYGEVFTGSVVISSGVDTVQLEGTT
jgi:predicted phage tail protein